MIPDLYLVTDRHATAGRTLPQVIQAALSGIRALPGDREWRVAVQLREKDLGGAALMALARELRAITHAAGAALFINERVDVALAAGADGVHLGWTALPIDDVRAIAPGLSVAVSTHDVDEIRIAKAKGATFAVYGPVFETPSKMGLLAPRGTVELAHACAVGLPVLALGGVDVSNAAACLAAGARGIACVRPVMGASEPAKVTRALRACCAALPQQPSPPV